MNRSSLAIAGLLVLMPVAAARAQASERVPPLTMEQALGLKLPSVSNLIWFEGSSQLIASWQEPESQGRASLEIWDAASGRRQTLTRGKYPSVSPDQRWLVYLDGKRWQLRSLADGKTTALGEEAPFEPVAISAPSWSRDSRFIAIVDALRPPAAPFNVEPQVENGVRVLDVGRAADGQAQGPFGIPRITIFDRTRLDAPRAVPLDEDFVYYGSWGLGRDYYFVAMQGYWRGKRAHTALKRLDTETLELSELYRLEGGFMQSARPEVSPDGRLIALAMDVDLGKWDDFVSLVLVDARTGAVRRLTTQQYVGSGYVWARDGQSMYFNGRFGGLNQIYRVTLDGNVTRITQGEQLHVGLTLSADGEWLAYRTADGYAHKDIRVRSTRDGLERIVAVTADPGHGLRLGQFKQVRWLTPDNLNLFGYVFLPPDFSAAKKYPLYIDVHGGGASAPLMLEGPLSLALNETPLEWHAWANLGYVVFVPDMRSSGEYGPRVAENRYTTRTWDWGGMLDDVRDVESGTRWMLSQGYIDPKRVAVFGHSAGGGRVNLLLTRSDVYSAGIIHDPIPAGALPNMITRLSGRNTGKAFDESQQTNGVKLSDDPSIYAGGFLFDGYKYRTPTLIMVGNPDKGAIEPLSSEILFSMLRQYKVPTRMLRYIDDGHNAMSVASALHRYREIRGWLEKHIPPPSE